MLIVVHFLSNKVISLEYHLDEYCLVTLLLVVLRSAVGKTHDLRSDLWWTIEPGTSRTISERSTTELVPHHHLHKQCAITYVSENFLLCEQNGCRFPDCYTVQMIHWETPTYKSNMTLSSIRMHLQYNASWPISVIHGKGMSIKYNLHFAFFVLRYFRPGLMTAVQESKIGPSWCHGAWPKITQNAKRKTKLIDMGKERISLLLMVGEWSMKWKGPPNHLKWVQHDNAPPV